MKFFKQLFCLHLNWADNPLATPSTGFKKTGYKDWRTNESWWECIHCGKVKRFSYNHIPINLSERSK